MPDADKQPDWRVSLKNGCGIRLYRNIRSLVGNLRDSVGWTVLLTPRWVVFLTVAQALSLGIAHRLAKVSPSTCFHLFNWIVQYLVAEL